MRKLIKPWRGGKRCDRRLAAGSQDGGPAAAERLIHLGIYAGQRGYVVRMQIIPQVEARYSARGMRPRG
jgi:hypothetical protein